jgi:hypothetical protein
MGLNGLEAAAYKLAIVTRELVDALDRLSGVTVKGKLTDGTPIDEHFDMRRSK